MRDDRARIADILEAVASIERYTSAGPEQFRADELVQVWVVHHLRIIGEAGRLLSPEARARCPGVPWTSVVGMRHILVHQYFGIDLEVVWRVVEEYLPALKAVLLPLATDPDSGGPGPE